MIRLKNILLEQKGSFKDLPGDYYSVMSGPIPIGGISSFESELAGFKFNSDSTVATKEYLLKPLVLTWLGSETFNVKYGGKNLGTYDIDKFEKWLNDMNTKRGGHLKIAPTLEKLKSLGFKKGKDPKTGYDSFVKYIDISFDDTKKFIAPSSYWKYGVWSCKTAIRVFKRDDDNWTIRCQMVSLDDQILEKIMNQEGEQDANFPTKRKVKKTSWLGNDYTDYEDVDVVAEFIKSIKVAKQKVQRVNTTTNKLIDTVQQLETNIREMSGLVGPFTGDYRYNRLVQMASGPNDMYLNQVKNL